MTDWLWSLYWFLMTLFWLDMWLIMVLVNKENKEIMIMYREMYYNLREGKA